MNDASLSQLDVYLPREIRERIERQWYAWINERARLEILCTDPEFLKNPQGHVATFSDHGVVHVRDVALQILKVLSAADGVLTPAREPERVRFMRGLGVMLAYVHDIGMVNFTTFGRAMHAEFATQAVLSADFDETASLIWEQNIGNLAWRLANLATLGLLPQNPRLVLREILAMANCHSKSTAPIAVLNDPVQLQALMLQTVSEDLHYQYQRKRVRKARHAYEAAGMTDTASSQLERLRAAVEAEEAALARFTGAGAPSNCTLSPQFCSRYEDFERDAYRWLVSDRAPVQDLVDDVVDVMRALRCADALRQRGTVQKTSGGYEVFVNQATANAVYAMRYGHDKLYLLEINDPMSAGEANIASSELGHDGKLRIAFHVGSFAGDAALTRAVHNAALIVNDIQADVIESYYVPGRHNHIEILLEGVDDNLEFAELVRAELARINPETSHCARTAPALQHVAYGERELYLQAQPVAWDLDKRRWLLARVAQSGHKTEDVDLAAGFKDVRVIKLEMGTTLIQAGEPSGFVYIPLDVGCRGYPLGGYDAFEVYPWIPLGVTGVVRGAARNATIIAYQDVELLAIPRGVYLRHWHHTYDMDEFVAVLKRDHT